MEEAENDGHRPDKRKHIHLTDHGHHVQRQAAGTQAVIKRDR